MMNTLPQDFLVGAATAAHQVEGNNIHSDYWAMEHMKYGNFNEPSLDAVDLTTVMKRISRWSQKPV